MKKIISLFISLAMLLSVFALPVYAATDEPTRMECEAYLLMDMRTGEVLLEKNADEVLEPASTTKMITAIVVIEQMDLSRTLTADAEVAKTSGTVLSLKDGEEISAMDALNALLVGSCNDCAVLFAKAMSGSTAAFSELMNQKLLEIGAESTHFVNPHGLHDEDHYTTARDLAKIALYCMENDLFREIVGKAEYTVPKTNKSDAREVKSTNKLLADEETMMYVYNDKISTKYEGAFGIKTGFTTPAGGCLVAAAERKGDHEGENVPTQLLSVVMKSTSLSRFADTHKILNWGFENFYTYKPVESGTDAGVLPVKRGAVKEVPLKVDGEFLVLLPAEASTSVITTETRLSENIMAPVTEGTVLGSVEILEGGVPRGSVNIVAAASVEKGGPLSVFGIDDATAHKIVVGVIAGFALLIAAFVGWVLWARHQTKVKKARRAAKLQALREEEARRRAMWDRDYENRRNDRE